MNKRHFLFLHANVMETPKNVISSRDMLEYTLPTFQKCYVYGKRYCYCYNFVFLNFMPFYDYERVLYAPSLVLHQFWSKMPPLFVLKCFAYLW